MQQNGASEQRPHILPDRVRVVVGVLFVMLLLVGVAAFMHRGPAILLDLAGLAQSLWCF